MGTWPLDRLKKVLILAGNPLCHNPRALKEAEALSSCGFEVEILGAGIQPEVRERNAKLCEGKAWRFIPLPESQIAWGNMARKSRRKIGNLVQRFFGRENHWQLGWMADELLKGGRKRRADLYLAQSEAGMWAAEQLRHEGKRVGVDMEDWFSEDLLPEARRGRPIRLLKKLERNLLCEGVYSSCTSEAMADALVKEYRCRRPTVVRNVFPQKDREGLDGKWRDRPGMARWMVKNDPTAERPKEAPVSIHWFSQTVGPGRGLEILFQTLEGMEGNWELHLRGNLKGYEEWLEGARPESVRKRMSVHGLVENEELLSRIAEHDIGFAGELGEPISRNLTITNKFFQYLQAGLAVVASDTEGQVEAASEAQGAVQVFRGGEKTSLAEKLGGLLRDRGALQNTRQAAWQAGAKFTWENESQRMQAALP